MGGMELPKFLKGEKTEESKVDEVNEEEIDTNSTNE